MSRTAIVIGGSGLTGHELLLALLRDEDYSTVKVLVRKPLELQHPKLRQLTLSFGDENALRNALQGDVVLCCIGTTIKKAGSRAAFREVDRDIPIRCGTIAHQNGVPQFVLMSSVGAHPGSSNFYLRTKGEAEAGLQAIGFSSLSILRPSFLLGKRKEARFGEKVVELFTPLMRLLCRGAWRKYRPVKAETVAGAMLVMAKRAQPGMHIVEGFDD